jgi:hypothetical protein
MLAASLVFIVGLLGLTSQAAPAPARTASNITYVKGPVTKAKAATACPSGSTPLDVTIGNIQQASAVLTAGDVSAKGAWIDSYNGCLRPSSITRPRLKLFSKG